MNSTKCNSKHTDCMYTAICITVYVSMRDLDGQGCITTMFAVSCQNAEEERGEEEGEGKGRGREERRKSRREVLVIFTNNLM